MTFDPAAAHAAIDALATEHAADVVAAVKAATDPLVAQHTADQATIADLRAQLAAQHPPTVITHTLADVIYDKFGPPLRTDKAFPGWGKHEAPLGNSARRDWTEGARPGVESPYPASFGGVAGYDHHNVWFQVIPGVGGMPAADRRVRLQLAIPQVWHLEPGATPKDPPVWVRKKSDAEIGKALNGGYWNGGPTYSKTVDWPSTEPNPYWRHEPDGTLSVDLTPTTTADGKPLDSQCIAHGFFPAFFPRQPILPGAQVAIVGAMRLISDDPKVDVGQARFLACLGGDVFPDATTTIGAGNKNPPIGIPRHRLLTGEWRHVGYITGDPRTYPPMPFLT